MIFARRTAVIRQTAVITQILAVNVMTGMRVMEWKHVIQRWVASKAKILSAMMEIHVRRTPATRIQGVFMKRTPILVMTEMPVLSLMFVMERGPVWGPIQLFAQRRVNVMR